MSDTASSSRPARPSPAAEDAGVPRPDDTPSADKPLLPTDDDQPTIISHRGPMPTTPVSDSAYRILQGKIMPGDRLGHFELVQYVGGGGMGRVFRAVDSRLARTCALKVLSPEQAADKETLLRFQNEAQSAARLDHDNITRVFYVGEDRGLHFIAFEFVEGVNIRRLVEQKGPLSLAEAVSYALQIAEALAHAADREVVHRDVKPSNVLITPEGRVKLIDMGLARVRRDDTSAADLTASGVTLGTFDYISPEQARDPRNADFRSDIYSLGCTFFYMLAGRPPFPEGTVLQKLLQHQGDQPPDLREFRPELPDEAARLLRKMLAKEPRHRYRDPVELVQDLMGLAEQVGLRPLGPGGGAYVLPRGPRFSFLHRHLPWIAPIAALLCIVATLHLYWSSSAEQTAQFPQPPNKPLADAQAEGSATSQQVQPESPPEKAVEPPVVPPGNGGPEPSTTPDDGPQPPEGKSDAAVDPAGRTPSPETTPREEPTGPVDVGPASRLVTSRSDAGGLRFDSLSGGLSVAEKDAQLLSPVSQGEAIAGHLSGAAGPATVPAEVGPTPVPLPGRSSVLVVGDQDGGENEFSTLSAACAKATDNDVIELRYNGRREQRPISLANLNVAVEAGKGYQPVIVFRPGKQEVDPVKYPRSMLTLTGGHLTLANVALELHVPREIRAESWSLFETRGGQTVTLKQCSLSICNASDKPAAYHEEVAFFRAKLAPETDAATLSATVDLLDCIARGEATFLCAEGLQPVHLIWENGLLATTERLLSAGGVREPPQPGELLQIDLRHLTAVVRSGLCRLAAAPSAPYQLGAQIRCVDSIIMAVPGAPLIEQAGGGTLDDFYRQIAWTGAGNFYEGVDVFWNIFDADQKPLIGPKSFKDWKDHWDSEGEEYRPLSGQVKFQGLPEAGRPLHTHTPADYALSESTAESPNPGVGAAGGGRDAGFQADRLPKLPPPPPAEPPAPAEPQEPAAAGG